MKGLQSFQWHRKPYWFKRKSYGWGWYPVTWQGWVVLICFVALAILWSTTLPVSEAEFATYTWKEHMSMYVPFVCMILGLVIICYMRGEKLRWQWGKQK